MEGTCSRGKEGQKRCFEKKKKKGEKNRKLMRDDFVRLTFVEEEMSEDNNKYQDILLEKIQHKSMQV